jgi:hypothetical protein
MGALGRAVTIGTFVFILLGGIVPRLFHKRLYFATPSGWTDVSPGTPEDQRKKVPASALRDIDQRGLSFAAFDLERVRSHGFAESMLGGVGACAAPITEAGLDKLAANVRETALATWKGAQFDLRSQSLRTIDDVPSAQLVYDITLGTHTYRQLAFMMPRDEQCAHMVFTAPLELYDADLPTFETAATSISGVGIRGKVARVVGKRWIIAALLAAIAAMGQILLDRRRKQLSPRPLTPPPSRMARRPVVNEPLPLVVFGGTLLGVIALAVPSAPPEASGSIAQLLPPTSIELVHVGPDSRAAYAQLVAQTAKSFGVGADLNGLSQHFPYMVEYEGAQALAPRAALSTPHIELKAAIEHVQFDGVGADQLVLHIRNRSTSYVAYRVTTEIPHSETCRSKGVLPQNAIALRPGQEIKRVECLWADHGVVIVRRVEVIEVPALSYFYVSRLPPAQALYPTRTSDGHAPPAGTPCSLVPWREIATAAAEGKTRWYDVIDFYGRHDCDLFSFPPRYHAPAGPVQLPVVPMPKPGE